MILLLPEEILLVVLRHLQYDDVVALTLVCKTLHRLTQDDQIWRHFFQDRYFTPNIQLSTLQRSSSSAWKYLYYNKSTIENQQWEARIQPVTLVENTVLEITCMNFDSECVVTGGGVSDIWDFDPAALVVPKTVQVHDIHTGKKLKTLAGHLDSVTCLQFNDDVIVSGSKDRVVKIWKRKGPKWNKKTKVSVTDLTGHSKAVCCLYWKDNMLVTGSRISYYFIKIKVFKGKDKTIKMWDLSTNLCVNTLFTESTIYGIQFAGGRLVSGGKDKKLHIWDLETGQHIIGVKGNKGWISSLQMNYQQAVTGGSDGRVRIWDLRTAKCSKVIKVDTTIFSVGWITSLQWDENKIVTGAADRTVKIMDIITGKCVNTLKGHFDAVTSVQFDNNKLLTGSLDRSVKKWDFSADNIQSSLDYSAKKTCTIA